MKMLTDHLADPDNLGIMIGNSTCAKGKVFVILHHRESYKHRILYGDTLEAIVDPLAGLI